MKSYFILGILWAVWCFIHSGMISMRVTNYLKRHTGDRYRYYRLVFNSFAVLTVVPVVLYGLTIQSPVIYRWDGVLRSLQLILFLVSLFLFYSGARHYDIGRFLGIHQLRAGAGAGTISESGRFDTAGILGVVRHPWYLGGIIFIWTFRPDLDIAGLVSNSIVTAYLIIGTVLEERKLLIDYGDEYRSYVENVSMLFPVKYVVSKCRKSFENKKTGY
ncbi:methyltransferase family protein [candidate division KSB1 bacterium]